MKLIYQHMLAFLAIILTSTAIVGFSVINFASNQAYQSTYQRLEGYASSLGELATEQGPDGLNNSSSNALIDSHFLTKLQIVMQSDDLQIRIFNGKNKQIYPKMGPQVKLPKNIWKNLKSGNEVRIKNDHDQKETYFSSKDAYTSVIIPWFNGSKMVGAVWIGARVKNVEQPINLAKRNLISAFVVTLIVSLILSYLISYYSLVKIKRLSRATKKVAQGDLSVQINHQDHDEIDDLASDFNSMVKALKKSAEAVKAQERRRDQFMADAAHEMRTPLTTINGILEGLEYDAIPEDSKPKSYQLMHRETNRLIRLVNENLDYEKIRNNQISLIKTNFDAAVPLNDLKTQLKTNAEKENDVIKLEIPEKLPIYADHDRFTQVMVNLVQNAIQFTQNGVITVSAKRLKHGTEISVNDTGIGMSEDQTKYIFERFYKADPSRAKLGGKGESGLGLAIVLSLIKQHGGKIKVDSTPGVGSTFIVTFFDKGFEEFSKED
ncbi:sensor histidine kinase [Lactobacillus mulieris]|uniref:histidine kinase n=1 Tax=Lactobacillus mulieris TaxID=2508708 RepID=A0AAW5WYX0_9LACO|nr:HAMP domain-containing sensor histidine kinase [Lactobacillus mulieris]MCZ3622505.1 HAMP domain-containing histidine kinase [Lactobacillus mulieris]MCZ3624143.1 HAMP domain-containing histidine kinase [Lactobacillus mulieris]MCZ3636512.1 HAMP domain-containing histidine kinase [Lactobacillus mulieris]MCZ3690827.1 HAMP domain-containing histidine kinase [Lactobacillus mulieris]MCZ3696817.1 HAMP domain-containing histidine kinase [Lactobacillus mulieris]